MSGRIHIALSFSRQLVRGSTGRLSRRPAPGDLSVVDSTTFCQLRSPATHVLASARGQGEPPSGCRVLSRALASGAPPMQPYPDQMALYHPSDFDRRVFAAIGPQLELCAQHGQWPTDADVLEGMADAGVTPEEVRRSLWAMSGDYLNTKPGPAASVVIMRITSVLPPA